MLEIKFLRDLMSKGAKCPFSFNLLAKTQGQANLAAYLSIFLAAVLIAFMINNMPSQIYSILIVGCIIFLVAFFNTNAAMIFLIFSMLLSPELSTGIVGSRSLKIRAEDIFLFVIFIGWLAKMAVNKDLGLIHTNPLNNYLIFYIFICLVSTAWSIIQNRLDIRPAFFYNLKYIEYFLIFFTVTNNLKSIKQAKRYVFFILLTCFVICVYSWLQIPQGERLSAPFEGGGRGAEPSTLAGYLLLMIGIVLGLALHASSLKNRVLLLCFCGFAIVPFIFTLSRGAWISFFPMCVALISLSKRYKLNLILIFIALLIVLPFILPRQVHSRIQETFAHEQKTKFMGKEIFMSESAVARLDSWGIAWEKFKQYPILGRGVPGGVVIDNQFTRVLIETGTVGSLIFIWMIFMIYRLALSVYRNTEGSNFAQGLSLGFLSGFVGILFTGFSSATFIIIRIMEPFWFLAAIVLMLPRLISLEES